MNCIKIEDLRYDLSPEPPIDEKNWNREKWVEDHPIDYFKMLFLINQSDNGTVQTKVFETLYRIIRLYIPDTLFKYFSLTDDNILNEKKFVTLANCKIYLSDIGSFNDPFDSKAFYYDTKQLMGFERLKHVGGRMIDDFTSYIRSTSLSANDVQSMPMWAHYSNNHKGFCVAYDVKSNPDLGVYTFPVHYTDQRLDITTMMYSLAQKTCEAIEQNLKAGIKQTVVDDLRLLYASTLLSNVKHSSWSYEKEFRCTIAANAKGTPFITANPKAIFIGMKCENKNADRLLKVGSHLKVPVYRMVFEECNPEYKLSIRRVN